MDRLVIHFVRGQKSGQTEIFPLGRIDQLSFGRDPQCDVRFDAVLDGLVSRNHATLEWTRGRPRNFVVTDLLSSNGTYVNGRRVLGPTELKCGDVLEFGQSGPAVRFALEEVTVRPGVTASIPKVTR